MRMSSFIDRGQKLIEAGKTPDATGIGYISHFATCPNAARHRKK